MPKRTDIKSILIIGAGPIVIGQACEFDYSGTQACKALREEGYRVILVNSNPATIMTDPDLADATYIEPHHARDRREDHRQGTPRRAAADHGRADGAQHLRWSWPRPASLEKYGVEMIGAKAEVIDKAEDRAALPQRDEQDRPGSPALARSPTRMDEALGGAGGGRPARRHPPLLHPRRHRRRHRLQPRGVRRDRRRGPGRPRRPPRCWSRNPCSAGRNTRWR